MNKMNMGDIPGPAPAAKHGQDKHEDLHEQENKGEGEQGINLDAGGTPPGVRAQLLALEGSDGLAAGWGIFNSRGGTPVKIKQKAFFVQLTQATSVNGLMGKWQASTHQLVKQLHAEVGDIKTAAEISYPAPEGSEYAQWLVTVTSEANMLCAVPNAPTVHVAVDNTLQLQPHQPAPGPSSGAPSWLIAEAAKDPRYASFKAGRHHVQTNLGVISSWQFAIEFSWGCSHRRSIRIKKSEVQQALGIGSSWMSDAQHSVMILWKFGEGGTSLHQNVIAVCISTAENDRMEAQVLLEYLMEQLND
ncbi:hypothetical protein J3R83DRAFT_8916 [Lanmaoa asiatica]|nr:hypothetical protein J3R83DRAFT_8916 [Lanmaoa asiatica]